MFEQGSLIGAKAHEFKARLSKERSEGHEGLIYDLTRGDLAAYEALGDQVAKASGEAAVIVHPYYAAGWLSRHPISALYIDELADFVTQTQEKNVPLICFEEEGKQKSLLKRLPRIKSPLFTINTIAGDPTPAIGISSIRDSAYRDDASREMLLDSRTSQMARMGVKHVLIGGRYFFIDRIPHNSRAYAEFSDQVGHLVSSRQWLGSNLYPNGCVGAVLKSFLRSGVEVDVASATSPARSLDDIAALSQGEDLP